MIKRPHFKILFFALIFISLLIFSFSYVSAACSPGDSCDPEGSTCTATQGCSSRTEYRCVSETDCGTEIQQRSISRHQHRTCTCGGCDAAGNNCTYSCGGWGACHDSGGPGAPSHHSNCSNDKICELGGSNWSSSVPNCEYLSAPTDGHPEDGIGDADINNVFLPVKLNWDDVRGAKSYIYRAWEATTTLIGWETAEATTTGSTTISEAIPTPCALNSSTTFSWKTTPCCYADRTVCKNWDDVNLWRLTTNLTPEMVTPADPDWNKTTQMALDVPIPVTLDWCNVEEADYYRLKLYTIVGGVEDCHRLLESGGNCLSMKIDKNTTWPYDELTSAFEDTGGIWFLRDTEYRWEAATCFMEEGVEVCSDFGQKWGLNTTSTLDISSFEQTSPLDGSTVGLPMTLEWNGAVGVNSTNYEVLGQGGPFTGTVTGLTIKSFDYPDLALDKSYNWRIKPCFDANGMDCENWTPFWTFRTTGAKPIVSSPPSPSNGANDVVIPVSFDWSDIPGAGSYKFQLADNAAFNPTTTEEVLLSSSLLLDYPDLEMDINYRWRVRTCARQDGTACGNWGNVWSFKTFIIDSPAPPTTPPNTIPPHTIDKPEMINFSWSSVSGAKAYRFVVSSSAGEEIFNELVSSNSISKNPILFPETGIYNWQVQACLDRNCIATGNWSNVWSFDLALIAPPEMRGGLVPCGRQYDDPDTPWNERESCQISHIFLLLRNVLDFLLWKVATVLLVLILLAAGTLFYISMGDSSTIFKVKSVLKTMMIGYIIIFFAWFFVNLFLAFLGYNFQFFGRWWEIPL